MLENIKEIWLKGFELAIQTGYSSYYFLTDKKCEIEFDQETFTPSLIRFCGENGINFTWNPKTEIFSFYIPNEGEGIMGVA